MTPKDDNYSSLQACMIDILIRDLTLPREIFQLECVTDEPIFAKHLLISSFPTNGWAMEEKKNEWFSPFFAWNV